MVEVPADVRPDLAERYRLLRPFDEAETALVAALVRRPERLPRGHEAVLRQALNLARLWVVPGQGGECVVGPQLGALRDRVRPLAEALRRSSDLDPAVLGPDAEQLGSVLRAQKEALLAQHLGRLMPGHLDKELGEKALVLAVGGGGGCGYVHLGAFSLLEELRLRPRLVVGSSIGSILGLFRAREAQFRDATVRVVTHHLSFSRIFRVLASESRQYGMPGALRLQLKGSLGRFFLNEDGRTMRIRDLPVPFLCVVTGVRREAARNVEKLERVLAGELRRGALGRLLHLKDLMANVLMLLQEMLATPGALRPIAIGGDDASLDFDVLDAVSFSSALPAVIQYDVAPDDARMQELTRRLLGEHRVDFLADGGLTANVPARHAWEHVQSGRIGTRNAFVLGLDCFAPQLGRNVLFLPLQRIAAENVARDRAFSQLHFSYRRTLSPTALVPKQHAVELAIRNGREELAREGAFLAKMLEPLPPI